MGKGAKGAKANKKHHASKMKDRRAHKERSKEEHLKRKAAKREAYAKKEYEAKRYTLDSFQRAKLFKLLQEVSTTSVTGKADLIEVFRLLDQSYELDIVDIEDRDMRDRLERLFEILNGQIERVEKEDGSYAYVRAGKKQLEPQLLKYFDKAANSTES